MTSPIFPQALFREGQDFILDLYEKQIQKMYSVCSRYITDTDGQEDVIQETWLGLIKNIDTLRTLDSYALNAYIHIAVRNTAITFLRKRSVDRKLIDQLNQLRFAENSINSDELFQVTWYKEQLQTVWNQLSRNEILLLEGRYIQGYSDAELAAQLHCKASSIRMMMSRARHKATVLCNGLE